MADSNRNELLKDILSATVNSGSGGLVNRITVEQASDLAGDLDSTKEYFIDGVVDMGSQQIEVPAGGLNISGYNFDVSKLTSSADNYTMFKSPIGGSGNVIGKDYAVEVTGVNSKVYDITSASGFDAFEFARINYNNCTSLGEISSYRQGLEVGTGRFGGKPELTLTGTWVGGFFVDTSIVRNIETGTYSLFKAGAGFTMESRFRNNMNVDLPAGVSLIDFSASNFVNPSTLQMQGAIVTRGGVFNAQDPLISPNVNQTELVCSWKNNNGMPNTFEGGSIGVALESDTVITTQNTFVELVGGSWISADLQHFDVESNGRLRHLGNTPREFKVAASLAIDGTQNNVLTVQVAKWDNSESTLVSLLEQVRPINNLVGNRDVAFFNINTNLELDVNDYVALRVANNTSTSNVTLEADSYYIVEER